MKTDTENGFTLAELLIVLAITALLSAGAITGWQRWQQSQQLRETALQLQAFLTRMRAHASWYNQDFTLWLIQGKRWCLGAGPQPTKGCQSDEPWQLIAPYEQVRITELRGEPGFYGRRDVAKAGSIHFGYPGDALRLIISSRGRIRLCRQMEENC